jgi:NAD(P)-dependent dehydrogenase (short-subunit alcohol dehydrogenase family)
MPLARPTQVIGTDMDITKAVLVTGGNSGLGLETCRELALMGHRVLVGCCDLRKRELINW